MQRQEIPDIEIIDLDDDRAAEKILYGTGAKGRAPHNNDGRRKTNGKAVNEKSTVAGTPDNNVIDTDTDIDDSDDNEFDDRYMNVDDSGSSDMEDDDSYDDDINIDDSNDSDAEYDDSDSSTMDDADDTRDPRPKKFPINIHVVLLAVVLLTFGFIAFKYMTWGKYVEQNENPSEPDDYYVENHDSILALSDSEGNMIAPNLKDGLSIAVFGNGPFAEDRNSEGSLANLLAQTTGATVYNCAVSGSYLTSAQPGVPNPEDNPWDAFSFYWMALYSTDVEVADYFTQSVEAMGADAPPEAAEVRETLSTLDFNTVDVIVVMYDATDYFAGRPAASTEDISAIQSFSGNLEAGLNILREHHPNTRIIVMSPTYAFSDQLDENGDYISSDIVRYGQDILSTYIIKASESSSAADVTFVDNFYVTFNEDNALSYLDDNIHLNAAGRKRVIKRLEYALNYFNAFYE